MAFACALAVIAHPDDESFGLGALLAALVTGGTRARALCFTRGESSTLGVVDDLGAVRADELAEAATVLGLTGAKILDYADGALQDIPLETLSAHVVDEATTNGVDLLVVFDQGGITGHPDHRRATMAALDAADTLDVGVLAWAIPEQVAETLNREFGTGFVGRREGKADLTITVSRERQLRAIACHSSQAGHNPVLWRRLQLMGDQEMLRWLRVPTSLAGSRPVSPLVLGLPV